MKSKTLFYVSLITLATSFGPAAHAQTFSVIHTFTSSEVSWQPYSGVTIKGNALYGTTTAWVNGSCGSVYQLNRTGSNWTASTIGFLPNTTCTPYARPVFGPDGHVYVTTEEGGPYNDGSVFNLIAPRSVCKVAKCFWTENVLHEFGSGTDGQVPGYGDLIWDAQGNIYGTTITGGLFNVGTVYQLMPQGNGWTENLLYSFAGPDGAYPVNGLVSDKGGNLVGTTGMGGANDAGTIFELTYVVGVGWTERVLYSFQNGSDGARPHGALIFDGAGNLYGAASNGGDNSGGTIFELSPSGDTWTFKLLYSITGQTYCGPLATLSMDGAGNLYGTTFCGGAYDMGSVFELSNTENGWVYTSLHDFTGGADGGMRVYSNVSIDIDGTLYGTTAFGGDLSCAPPDGCGVVWMIKP